MSEKSTFKAVIEPTKFSSPGAKDLKITHNGYQWTEITLTPDEMHSVACVIQSYLEESEYYL